MAGNQKRFQIAMTRAEEFSQRGNWANAMKAYQFALAEFPNNVVAIVGFGKAAMSAGKMEFAWKAFHQALRVNPTNHEALSAVADIQERMGQLGAAAETYLRVGNVFAARGDYEIAIDYWTRATKLAPNLIEAHRQMADGLAELGRTQQAARQYLTVASIHQKQNKGDEAREYIQEAENLLPNDPGVAAAFESLETGAAIKPEKVGKAPAASQKTTPSQPTPDLEPEEIEEDGDDDDLFDFHDLVEEKRKSLLEESQQDAMAELANIAFEDVSNPNTMLVIQAIDFQSREQFSEAIENYRQALDGGMKRPALYFNLGIIYKTLGEFGEAAEMLQVSMQDQKYRFSSQYALGETYRAANNVNMALNYFLELIKAVDMRTVTGGRAQELQHHYENNVSIHFNQGDINKLDTFIEAISRFFSDPSWEKRSFEARHRMDSVSKNGIMSLAEYLETPETEAIITAMALTTEYMNQNLLLTASEECLRAIQKAPDYLPLHVRLVDILLKKDQTDEAVEKYLQIAKVYRIRNNPDQAFEIYEKVLDLAPMDVTVRSDLIDMCISANDIERALEQYLQLADSYYQLAQVDRALEKYSEALRLTESVSNSKQWQVDILQHMGDIYSQRFDWNRAAAVYEELIKIKPDNEKAQQRLIDLYFRQGKGKQAIAVLDRLLTFYQRRNPPKGLEFLKDLVSSYPEDMRVRHRLALAYVQNGMTKEAIAEYDTLGEMQLEKGLRKQAVQTIQAILNLKPKDAKGYRRLLSQIKGGAI